MTIASDTLTVPGFLSVLVTLTNIVCVSRPRPPALLTTSPSTAGPDSALRCSWNLALPCLLDRWTTAPAWYRPNAFNVGRDQFAASPPVGKRNDASLISGLASVASTVGAPCHPSEFNKSETFEPISPPCAGRTGLLPSWFQSSTVEPVFVCWQCGRVPETFCRGDVRWCRCRRAVKVLAFRHSRGGNDRASWSRQLVVGSRDARRDGRNHPSTSVPARVHIVVLNDVVIRFRRRVYSPSAVDTRGECMSRSVYAGFPGPSVFDTVNCASSADGPSGRLRRGSTESCQGSCASAKFLSHRTRACPVPVYDDGVRLIDRNRDV